MQALAEQLAEGGTDDFNIPKVARRAGVSVRTIYRYFPAKESLLEALAVWINDRLVQMALPRTPEEIADNTERAWAHFEENETLMLAQLASPAGRAVRARGRRRRIAAYRAALQEITGNLEPREVQSAIGAITSIASLETWRAMKQDFGMGGDEPAKTVAWALRALIADLRRRNEQAGKEVPRSPNA
jgi:AcrR family transcriptional regulator